jgi:hypothetical protein
MIMSPDLPMQFTRDAPLMIVTAFIVVGLLPGHLGTLLLILSIFAFHKPIVTQLSITEFRLVVRKNHAEVPSRSISLW